MLKLKRAKQSMNIKYGKPLIALLLVCISLALFEKLSTDRALCQLFIPSRLDLYSILLLNNIQKEI